MVLPPYKGAVFRGAFGNALRQLVCVAPQATCAGCFQREHCLYLALFEPPPPPGFADAAKFIQAPRPYVINPPLTNRQAFYPGGLLCFDLTLIGPALEALPYFIHIFTEIGRRGLGPERGRYTLEQVDCLQNGARHPIFEGSSCTFTNFTLTPESIVFSGDAGVKTVSLNFLTPLRLKQNGKLVTRLTFPLVFHRLAQRLSLLTAFYGGHVVSSPTIDLTFLLDQAHQFSVLEDKLHWYDWERYSSRQDANMNLGGLRGSITFAGHLEPFLPFLRLGAQVNVGQGTTFGLGGYEINYN